MTSLTGMHCLQCLCCVCESYLLDRNTQLAQLTINVIMKLYEAVNASPSRSPVMVKIAGGCAQQPLSVKKRMNSIQAKKRGR